MIGSGPNGLAAAIVLAREGLAVGVLEANEQIGGGARSAELTLPGFVHDMCSAVHPLALGSPFFRTLPLHEHGLEWVYPPVPLAHPFDDGTCILLLPSLDDTAQALGPDATAYRNLFGPLLVHHDALLHDILGPLRWPHNPFALARFGMRALRSARGLADSHFHHRSARALFAGLAAHSALALDAVGSASFGLVLGLAAHAVGWPFPRGGAQKISNALASYLRSLGGHIFPGVRVHSLRQLPSARLILCDITPRQLLSIAGDALPNWYRRKLGRYQYGSAAFKLDWSLDGPIPWTSFDCARAGTVHLGGDYDEIAQSERAPWRGQTAERPFVLLAQPSLFDPLRAPAGNHTAWAYCHVPNGYEGDMTAKIEAQVERFAPGFRKRILARSVMSPAALERHNANLVGGDISGGAAIFSQLLLRPTASLYSTPLKGLYLCSSSTPPGGGVHGMCGYFAAKVASRHLSSDTPASFAPSASERS